MRPAPEPSLLSKVLDLLPARRVQAAALTAVLAACGGGTSPAPTSPPSLTLRCERIPGPGLDSFRVLVEVARGDSTPPAIACDRGSVSTVAPIDATTFAAVVAPAATGEHRVTVTLGSQAASITALVLADVHADFDQPIAVPGLVNTTGYEDGAVVTADGRYLLVQYSPVRASAAFVFTTPRANGGCGGHRLLPTRCDHPWLDNAVGPLSGPARPGFATGRFAGTTHLHNAASWGFGVDEAPWLALPTMFYGFRRQPDGSFAEPFAVAFDDLGDALTGPYGPAVLDLGAGTHRLVFTLQDLGTAATGRDLFYCDLRLGQNTVLGTYAPTSPGNPPMRSTPFASARIELDSNAGTQGNPFAYAVAGTVLSLWTDDEYDQDADTGKITARLVAGGVFPTAATYAAVVLPDVVNQPGTVALQPWFRGNGLYFTQDFSIAYAAYGGAHDATAFADPSNWTAPVIQLQKDTTITNAVADVGKVAGLGEAALAQRDGRDELYFVYAVIRSIDPITGLPELDFQIGRVERR